jgi:hypothetical protein
MKSHFNLVYIKNVIEPIDIALDSYRDEIAKHSDPDTFGIIDQYEQFLGIGFAICQSFLSSVHKGKNKGMVFVKGSTHSSGKSYAQITNACANYWKHNDEWVEANLSNQAKSTITIFSQLSVNVWESYPLSNMFTILLGENGSFGELLIYLNGWANDIE